VGVVATVISSCCDQNPQTFCISIQNFFTGLTKYFSTKALVQLIFSIFIISPRASIRTINSFFLTNKNVQAKILLDSIKDIQTKHKKNVKYIKCDNAGENSSLQTLLHKEGLGITFEYSARSTPQQNGKEERPFATLYSRMRAMMLTAGMDLDQKTKLCVEAATIATKLSNIVVGTDHTRFFNNQPAYLHHLRTFGEAGIVADKPGPTIKLKLADRGLLCAFVGYTKLP
jgi:vesicle coat complex subunit